ncbi:MAG: shikimate kinase [Bacteroidaceae bacterium]|nr:shikimate kinase [Bacteroidaceae bacterium]
MNSVFLIGYMGAGKTTIGLDLADTLNYEFVDLDWYIEDLCNRCISDIFSQEGEARFREIEHEALLQVSEKDNAVIAVGGGTPCFYDNMDIMNHKGISIYLKASVKTLIEHIHIGSQVRSANRPLLNGMDDKQMGEFITKNLILREPFYLRATHIVPIPTLRGKHDISLISQKISCLL